MGPRSAPSRQDPQPPGRSVSQVGPLTQAEEQRPAGRPGLGANGVQTTQKEECREAAADPTRRGRASGSDVCVASLPACTPPSCFPTSVFLQNPSLTAAVEGAGLRCLQLCSQSVMGGGGCGGGAGAGSAASIPLPTPSPTVTAGENEGGSPETGKTDVMRVTRTRR